jgi:hypothetical protein
MQTTKEGEKQRADFGRADPITDHEKTPLLF